jgi:hypothetical protein
VSIFRASSRAKFSFGLIGEKMHKFLKALGVLAAVILSVGQASAFSSSIFPVALTGTPEDVVLSFTNPTSVPTFNLNSLSLALGSSAPFGANVLLGVPGGSLTPFTSSSGGTLTGSGTLSEIITAPAGNYTFSFNTGAESIHFSVSPVPLPAAFPLFLMALIGLGFFGYQRSRMNNALAV